MPELPAAALIISNREYAFWLQTAILPGSQIAMYFIDCPALFERDGLYTNDADEHRRFLLFTRAALEVPFDGICAAYISCNDWHTAFLPLYLKTLYRSDALPRPRQIAPDHPQHWIPGCHPKFSGPGFRVWALLGRSWISRISRTAWLTH